MKTLIGYLKNNEYFVLDGKAYRVGCAIKNTNGYVACTNVLTNKVSRFCIDTEVEKCDTIICHDREDAKRTGDSIGWINVMDCNFINDGKVKMIVRSLEEVN